QDGLWLPTELKANVQLRPEPALVADLPENVRPEWLNIQIEPLDAETDQDELPLQVKLDAQGATPATLQARVRLNTAPPYVLQIEQAQLQLRSSKLK
ncbi:dicarboxylate transport, partial [Klebsiella pneumoniae]|nr:dicarboxylate transport [Klebsiella pneumoniae]